MLRQLMHYLRRSHISKNDHARNGYAAHDSSADKIEAEFERRMAEEARRYESDLRKLAKA